jgi:pimeloyl-ACP methyl ester carboxylesterase
MREAGTGLREHEARVRGRLLHYRTVGHGEPVVLLHGLSGSSRWWRRNLSLAEQFELYLVDLPSGRIGPRRALSEASEWLHDFMRAAELPRAHVVAHSMGGMIAVRLAANRPEAVDRLVLVAPAGIPSGRSMIGHALPLLRAAISSSPEFLLLLARDALRTGPLTLWRTVGELLAEDVRDALPAIRAPTLLIWGDGDPIVPPTVARVLQEEIASARLLLIEGAGHVPMYDHPARFNDAVRRFLQEKPVGE